MNRSIPIAGPRRGVPYDHTVWSIGSLHRDNLDHIDEWPVSGDDIALYRAGVTRA